METLLDFLMEKWPILALLMFTMVITAVVVWIASGWYHRFIKVEEKTNKLPCEKQEELHHRVTKVEDDFENLPCEKHEEVCQRFVKTEEKVENLPCEKHEEICQRFVKTEEKVENLPCEKHEDIFHQIKEELVAIRTSLNMINMIITKPDTFAYKFSPRELNETGRQLFAEIDGQRFLEENKDRFIKGIDDRMPKTALDVEESAVDVLVSFVDDDIFIGMKKWVYKCPDRKILIDGIEKNYSVTIYDVCFVLSLPLRNMYLELHPELE